MFTVLVESALWATAGVCVCVIWVCCRVTLSVMEGVLTPPLPEGKLDTLHDSLYLHLSIIAFPLSSRCPALLPLSPSTFPTFSCHQCLRPPSHSLPPSFSSGALHWATAVNRFQESRQGLHQDHSCRAQTGLCVHSAGYSMVIADWFQSLPFTGADRSASRIMSENDAL